VGRNIEKSTDCAVQFAVEEKKKVHIRVPQDESHVSVGGLLALSSGNKRRLRKKT
jgi:hypothetical protein